MVAAVGFVVVVGIVDFGNLLGLHICFELIAVVLVGRMVVPWVAILAWVVG